MWVSPRPLSDIPHDNRLPLPPSCKGGCKRLCFNGLAQAEIHATWQRPCTIPVVRSTKQLALLICLAAQVAMAQLQVGDNTKLSAGGNFTVGYAGDYGDQIQSSHGLQFGASGTVNGYYYTPNFLNFSVTPYYNNSRADSSSQSLTDASGVAASANFFTGSRFPGSVSYHYDYNSTGTFGLPGTPNFTTQGNGQGFSVNWSALFPDLPTLTVGYQQGSGSGTLYGTNEESSSEQKIFNVHSSYHFAGFNMNGFYDHTSLNSQYPEFLTGVGFNVSDSSGYDYGANASRNLSLWNGSMYASYSHSSYNTDYIYADPKSTTNSGYDASMQTAGVNFHPTQKLGFYFNENWTDNLSSFYNQVPGSGGGVVPPVNVLGNGSSSFTMGGGANYVFTQHVNANAQATYYTQSYLGQTFTGTFLSGNVNYTNKLFNMFSFSAGLVDSSTGRGDNNVGFVGTVNYFHRFGQWETSGSFSYAQNVQSLLVTYTTSYYNYNANIHRKFSSRVQWTAAFNGSKQGLSSNKNSSSDSYGFSTSLSLRQVQFSGQYLKGSGSSIITGNTITPLPPVPGINQNLIYYNAENYGGSINWTPIRRLIITGTYSRSLSDTFANGIFSKNNTEIIYSQLQYHLRRISVLAGYTRFTQGISATGVPPGTVTSYYGGISRWFDFF
jgi:hypothetical protein